MLPTGKNDWHSGFTLVVTLSLMVILTILAVGLLTLSSVSMRSSGQGEAAAVARSNARMALMLAIGDLQKLTGPDQRVTAPASILQTASETESANSQWTGVWRTDGLKDDAASSPFVQAETRSGSGYSDGRSSKSRYDRADQTLGWLVSGSPEDPAATLPADASATLRGGRKPVRVPKVLVSKKTPGAYAYYVSDESTKARINLADPHAPSQPDPAEPGGPGMKRWLSPQVSDSKVFLPGEPLIKAESLKLTSTSQLELSSLTGGAPLAKTREILRNHDDDFTVHSRSVLADAVRGGLKGDLTAYLEDNSAPALGSLRGITDASLINPELGASRSKSGPKFGLLRSWHDLRKSVSMNAGKPSINSQVPKSVGVGKANIVDPGAAFTSPLMQPVMTEAVYYQNHVITGDATSTRMIELIYPRVVLWNPFSVSLKTRGHVVLFDFALRQNIGATFKTSGGKDPGKGVGSKDVNLLLDTTNHPELLLGFQIPPTEFAPGEAVVFCAPSKNQPFNASDLRTNTLSATASPADLGFFTRNWPKNDLGANIQQDTVQFTYVFNSNLFWNASKIDGRTQTITLHDLSKGATTGEAISLLSSNGPVAVRQISLDNFSRGNNGRWLPNYTKKNIRKLADAVNGSLPPDSLLAYGARFRFLYETYANRAQGNGFNEPWYFSPLAHHNINAPNIHRWPNDNIFGLRYTAVSGTGGSGPHLYSYGPLAQARQWSEWLDTEVMPRRGPSGTQRTAVFSDASFASPDSVYPIYDVPLPGMPLTSLGTLQHAPLSPFTWHPTHVIGNSIPSPFVPLGNATSHTKAVESGLWTAKTAKIQSSPDITGFNQVRDEVLINDLSFELNQALWDRYFLSAIPRSGSGWTGDRWDPAIPLPNARMTVNPLTSDSGRKEQMLDFHRAARSLWLEGGFNVNSTSVEAWKSLLRSFRSVEVPTGNPSGSVAGSETSFPGQAIVFGAPSKTPLDASSDGFWRDYRSLSDKEIESLALAITAQVRRRAPFLGVADFVNRRLVDPEDTQNRDLAYGGTLQTALNLATGINGGDSSNKDLVLPSESAAAEFTYGADYWGGPIVTPSPQTYQAFHDSPGGRVKPKGWGAASQITQADILQQLGPVLVARGDTFVVRACGEARDAKGKVTARAWCEAVVQRSPVPVNPDPASQDLNPMVKPGKADWGRRYEIESFRWLSESEI